MIKQERFHNQFLSTTHFAVTTLTAVCKLPQVATQNHPLYYNHLSSRCTIHSARHLASTLKVKT